MLINKTITCHSIILDRQKFSFECLIEIMFKPQSLIVIVLMTIAFAKENSSGKKKEDVGTVIGIDLGVSLFFELKNLFYFFINILDNLFMCWYL